MVLLGQESYTPLTILKLPKLSEHSITTVMTQNNLTVYPVSMAIFSSLLSSYIVYLGRSLCVVIQCQLIECSTSRMLSLPIIIIIEFISCAIDSTNNAMTSDQTRLSRCRQITDALVMFVSDD